QLDLDPPNDFSRAAAQRVIEMHRELTSTDLAGIDESLAGLYSDEPAIRYVLAEPLLARRAGVLRRLAALAELDTVVLRGE
ncbi:hypothetical protein, partial [Saezia sanguinis]